MDNVQKRNICTNVPSPETFRPCQFTAVSGFHYVYLCIVALITSQDGVHIAFPCGSISSDRKIIDYSETRHHGLLMRYITIYVYRGWIYVMEILYFHLRSTSFGVQIVDNITDTSLQRCIAV
jgi:hypothetical protein